MTHQALIHARALRVLPLALAALILAGSVVTAAGTAGGALMLTSAALAGTLAFRLRGAVATERATVERVALGALLLTPGIFTAYFAISSGGFFPDTVAIAALVLALLVITRTSVATRPFAGLGLRAGVPGAALVLLAGWVLASGRWSDAPGRALIEFDRALLYAGAFLLFASIGSSARRIAWATRAVAASMVLVCGLALFSRLAPDVLVTAELYQASRLGFPLTYWNALGIFAAIATVLCLHLASSTDEPRPVRVLASGALPIVAVTLLLTFSRGSIGAAVVGLVAYAVLGRPRGLIPALLAVAAPTALALVAAWDATLLSGPNPTSAGGGRPGA